MKWCLLTLTEHHDQHHPYWYLFFLSNNDYPPLQQLNTDEACVEVIYLIN